ncbi:hypothetical protein [Bradyrhizobium cenepequi]|uniref:hypothetical protein n=1 Tax=Bradyrhizobium cenepequi TaxID=2821403 RepID=UPI001CE2E80A|nr:hypothetical protein [Bradyrhizobium cenepequi]MCA6108300.1 hypothetical protein [Bradyrhizobium cenepequi]
MLQMTFVPTAMDNLPSMGLKKMSIQSGFDKSATDPFQPGHSDELIGWDQRLHCQYGSAAGP